MCIVNFLDALLGQSSVFKYMFLTLSSIKLEYNYIGKRNLLDQKLKLQVHVYIYIYSKYYALLYQTHDFM